MRRISTVLAVAAASVGALLISAGPAAASTPSGCSSVSQIGTTAYVVYGGETAASVKQYYGCGKNYSYVYIWESFRNSHTWNYASTGVETPNGALNGAVLKYSPTYEIWSNAADTSTVCTRGFGRVQVGSASETAYAYTSRVC